MALPIEDEATRWDPVNYMASSPLYDNGILYMINVRGKLYAVDVKENKVLYMTKPPFDFKNGFHRKTYGLGLAASITLAGKHIYIIDSTACTIVIAIASAVTVAVTVFHL